jgi:Icc protein
MGMQLGQYPAPTHVIAHISDTHFLGGKRPLYNAVDTDAHLTAALQALEESGISFDALLFTGDITDLGEADAYSRIRDLVEPVAARMAAEIIWVMGNHDDRAGFRGELLRESSERGAAAPIDRVTMLGGLRIISLDTSVPGYHHGELSAGQLTWLHEQLATAAPEGTVLALHHPPVPSPVAYMQVLELQEQSALADVLTNTDVRVILGGHLHYSTHGTFAGIPVAVAAATCYSIDAAAPNRSLRGVDAGQSVTLVHVYPDQIVHTIVPFGDFPVVASFGDDFTDRLEHASRIDLREIYSKQVSAIPEVPYSAVLAERRAQVGGLAAQADTAAEAN